MNTNVELAAILMTVICNGLYVAYRMGKFEEKLINIEKKQDKHNSVIERTFVMEEQIKVANHRIEDLEERV